MKSLEMACLGYRQKSQTRPVEGQKTILGFCIRFSDQSSGQ